MTDELKPCPFCMGMLKAWGASAFIHPNGKCVLAGRKIQKDFIDQWNTRTDTITPPDALIRAALDAVECIAQAKHDAAVKWAKVYVPSHDGQTDSGLIADEIRALRDNPDFIARIIKAAEGRG